MSEPQVLDAWALLAWLGNDAPAADRVGELLARCEEGEEVVHVSLMNAAEVFYNVAKRAGLEVADLVRFRLERSSLTLEPVRAEQVWLAAHLKAKNSMSLADAFAAALALQLGARLWTGDPDFEPLLESEGLRILWLRRDESGATGD